MKVENLALSSLSGTTELRVPIRDLESDYDIEQKYELGIATIHSKNNLSNKNFEIVNNIKKITLDEYNAKQKEENRKKYLAQFAGIDGFGSADTRYMSYPFARSAQENTGDTLRISCLQYVPPTDGGGNFGVEIKNKYITQNFADGKTKYLFNNKANQKANNEARKAAGLEETTYKDMELKTTFTDANTRISKANQQNELTKFNIELPIPQEINDSQSVTWGDDRVNAIELAGVALAGRIIEKGALGAINDARNAIQALGLSLIHI